MNGFTELKDIRFPDTKANILLRGGMISRENLMNVKNSMITMHDVHFGIAKRINDVTSLEVKHLDEWRSVMCGDTVTLQSIYALTHSDDEKHKHIILTDNVEIHSAHKIESVDEESVEETESHEDEVVEEDTHEESEVVDTVETTSDHDANEVVEEDTHEESEVVETTSYHETIKGYGIGTITGVTTIDYGSTSTAEVAEEPTFDVSNAEPTATSTSTASTTINNQGNARRQVNINTHGKHRRR